MFAIHQTIISHNMAQASQANETPEAYHLIIQKWDTQMAAELVEWSFHNVREPHREFFQSLVEAHHAKMAQLTYLEQLFPEQKLPNAKNSALHAFDIWIGCRIMERSLLADSESLLEARDWSLNLSINKSMPHPLSDKKWQWAWMLKEEELKRDQMKRYKIRGLDPRRLVDDEKALERMVNEWIYRRG